MQSFIKVENLTKSYNGYLGGMCLHEWSKTIDESDFNRETLKDICYEVYCEHQETLTTLMSKEGRLVCCLVLSAVQCVRKHDSIINDRIQPNNNYRRRPEPRKNEPSPEYYAPTFGKIDRLWLWGPASPRENHLNPQPSALRTRTLARMLDMPLTVRLLDIPLTGR